MSLNHFERGRSMRRSELNGTFLARPEGAGAWDDPLRDEPGAVRLQAQEALGPPRASLEIVVDGSNLLPFHFLRTGDRMGRAVVKLQRDDGATGTGFLVAPDILLTNHHVLPDGPTAASSMALANYEVHPPGDPAGRSAAARLEPGALFVTNADLDFTFCGVAGLDFLGAIPLDRERMHVAVEEAVSVIQHPRGRPKEISLRDNRVVRADGVVLQYACDTEPGSSGSPVFNDHWKPVAIHHASVLTDSPEGRRVGADSRARYLNEGIRLSAIALWLDTAEAEGPAHRDAVSRLRALFGGLNPRAGFFGALGRRSHGRPAAEAVAENYFNRLEVLDVGFWDTRALLAEPGGLRGRAAEIGRVVADMGLDVWCFSEADPAALDAICERLWAAHGLSYQPIPLGLPSPDGGAPGVLIRPSKTLAAEPVADAPPHRVRIRAATRLGGEAEFRLVPATRGPWHIDLARAVRREAAHGGPDWLVLAVADLAPEPAGLDALAAVGPVLAASAPIDGAAVLIPGGSLPARVFLSPNLRPVLDPTARLAPAQDRALPASLAALPGPRPIALRIALDRAEPIPIPPPPPPLLTPQPLPRSGDGLDLLIERKLRDLLGPVVSKLLIEARGEAAP